VTTSIVVPSKLKSKPATVIGAGKAIILHTGKVAIKVRLNRAGKALPRRTRARAIKASVSSASPITPATQPCARARS
jgi:hypothetical protein